MTLVCLMTLVSLKTLVTREHIHTSIVSKGLQKVLGVFGDSPKILWYPPKFWAVPFPDVFLKLLKCLAPSPSPNFGGFWGFSPENPRYMDCPHPRSFPRAFKRCIPVPTPSPRGRGIPGDYRGSIPRIPSIIAGCCHFLGQFQARSSTLIDILKKVLYQKYFNFIYKLCIFNETYILLNH